MPTLAFVNWPPHLGTTSMGKRIQSTEPAGNDFGERLAALRKAAGFTQVELAAELGISQRMVAYYESPQAAPPANLLPAIATALGVSIDELFGRAGKRRLVKQDGDSRLRCWRAAKFDPRFSSKFDPPRDGVKRYCGVDNSSFSASLEPFRRAGLAFAELVLKRHDSLPVSTMWQ